MEQTKVAVPNFCHKIGFLYIGSHYKIQKHCATISAGLEEFENKVDQIAAGHEENSWISALYKKFSDSYINGNDSISENQMEGMEPPMLDETWGLEDIARLHQENGNGSEFIY